jgi:hypothetical protein
MLPHSSVPKIMNRVEATAVNFLPKVFFFIVYIVKWTVLYYGQIKKL